jgi:hypothetical protein
LDEKWQRNDEADGCVATLRKSSASSVLNRDDEAFHCHDHHRNGEIDTGQLACDELGLRSSGRNLDTGSAAVRNGLLCASGAARDLDVLWRG